MRRGILLGDFWKSIGPKSKGACKGRGGNLPVTIAFYILVQFLGLFVLQVSEEVSV